MLPVLRHLNLLWVADRWISEVWARNGQAERKECSVCLPEMLRCCATFMIQPDSWQLVHHVVHVT